MNEQEIIRALIVAFPFGAVLAYVAYRAPAIIKELREYRVEVNKGEKERAEILAQAQTEMVRAAAVMVDKSALAVKEFQQDSRAFWSSRIEELQLRLKQFEVRVRELEEQVEDKDKRIEELEAEVKRLHNENEVLRTRLDNAGRKPKSKKEKLAA